MRDIKFRAWDKDEKEMLELVTVGCTRKDSWGSLYIKDKIINGFDHRNYDIMQFTGLKDKNGVDIYEGDITKLGEGGAYHLCVVEFKNDELCYQLTNRKTTGEYIGELLFVRGKDIAECEVIGTLYENPELLEVAE